MNGDEQATLNEVSRKLTEHIRVSDERHVANTKILNEIKPILKAAHDKKIIDKFVDKTSSSMVSLLKLIALIVGIIASIWLFIRN